MSKSSKKNSKYSRRISKDERVEKQAVEQSKLISQRKGERAELSEGPDGVDQQVSDIVNNIISE